MIFFLTLQNEFFLKIKVMLKQRLIAARKERNFTQQAVAERIAMTQSQYQRREQGKIRIVDEEWERIAQVLGKDVSEIKEEDAVTSIYNFDNNSGNYSASNNYFYNIPDFIMKNQQEYIETLKKEIETLKTELMSIKAKK
jgi:transcriptional regulator with XRE-family HTH domain